jgi:hypothetical protein
MGSTPFMDRKNHISLFHSGHMILLAIFVFWIQGLVEKTISTRILVFFGVKSCSFLDKKLYFQDDRERGDVPQFAPSFPEVQLISSSLPWHRAKENEIGVFRQHFEKDVTDRQAKRRNGEGSPEDHRIMMNHATFLPYLDCIYLHIYIYIIYYNVIHRFMMVYVRFLNRHQ